MGKWSCKGAEGVWGHRPRIEDGQGGFPGGGRGRVIESSEDPKEGS